MGAAKKVTVLPAQNGLDEAAMVRLTGNNGLTTMVMGALVMGFANVQVSDEVSLQVISSPFAGVYVNVLLLPPEGILFTYH
jgi:hypothetical protein